MRSGADTRFHTLMMPLVISLLLGLGARLNVQIIGFITLSELAVLALVPWLLPRLLTPAVLRPLRLMLPLGMLWFASAVLSDVWNATTWSLTARGLARIVMFVSCIPFCSWFFAQDTRRRLAAFYLGLIPSSVLSGYVLQGGVYFDRLRMGGQAELTWQTHWVAVAFSATLFVALLLYQRQRIVAYLVSGSSGVMNFFLGSRSVGAALITGVMLCVFRNMLAVNDRWRLRRLTTMRLLVIVAIAAGLIAGSFGVYRWAATTDRLGEAARVRFETQSQARFGVLGGGRAEFFAGLLAVRKSPLVGYGSWAIDTDGIYLEMCDWLQITPNRDYYRTGYPVIPSHSHLLSAWVENGLGGGVFWLYILYFLGLQSFYPMKDESHLRLWAYTAAVALAWNILFSPIGDRLITSLTLAVMAQQLVPTASHRRGNTPQRQPPMQDLLIPAGPVTGAAC